MKKIITSASVVALGVVGLQAAYTPGLTATEQSKIWSVSATLRGFYDDNYATRPAHYVDEFGNPREAKGSFGFELSPSLGLNFPLEATLLSLSYTYDMKYYFDRDNSADHGHFVKAMVDHAFSENYKINLSDNFALSQEGTLLNDPNNLASGIARVDGNNWRNIAGINFNGQVTRQMGFMVGYQNSVYDYDNEGYKPLLNRMEHMITINNRWTILPQTVAILGYQFGMVNHDENRQIVWPAPIGAATSANVRDSDSHYVYVGVDQSFTSQLSAALRVGAQFIDYPNVKNTAVAGFFEESTVIPYVDANATYSYLPGSYVQVGVKHTTVTTDLYAQDSEATAVYGSLNHKITPKLTGSLIGQVQFASLNNNFSSTDRSAKEYYYVLGFNLAYQFNQYLSAETGYNFDRDDSGVPNRSFSRNRVYLGLRASY